MIEVTDHRSVRLALFLEAPIYEILSAPGFKQQCPNCTNTEEPIKYLGRAAKRRFAMAVRSQSLPVSIMRKKMVTFSHRYMVSNPLLSTWDLRWGRYLLGARRILQTLATLRCPLFHLTEMSRRNRAREKMESKECF